MNKAHKTKKYPLFLTEGMAKALYDFTNDFSIEFKNYYKHTTILHLRLRNFLEELQ